ncbi:hypothetical protein O3M35_000596 [Rhynocoris fuscipes]|uniref:Uncharacterized protein n=1 Tax=Rhynocoris fuscipes TaxID=488301 RepID=A0AAW1DS91_9HEMI
MNSKFSYDISKIKTCIADKDEYVDLCHTAVDKDTSSKHNTCSDKDPDIESVKLPKIDFCEPLESDGLNKNINGNATIIGSGEYDREKLRSLILEIVRNKSVHKKRNHEIEKIISDNRKKNEKIKQLEQDLAAFKLGCSSKENDIKFLADAHEIQANALKKQILEFQKTIISLTKEKLNLEIEIKKLKKENEYLSNSNKSIKTGKRDFYKKYRALKEKLKTYSENSVQNNTERKDQNEDQNKIQNEDQKEVGCSKCYLNNEKTLKKNSIINTGNPTLDELLESNDSPKKEVKEADVKVYPIDDNLISELFFLPSQQKLPDIQLFSDI